MNQNKLTCKKFILFCHTGLKFLLLILIWQMLELIFYHHIQPRIVDDIISIVLFWYMYQYEKFKHGSYIKRELL